MIKTKTDRDQELLMGILHGKQPLVQAFYQEYRPGIIRYIRQHGGTEADGKDVFQDAVFVLYRKMKNEDLTLTASLSTYLLSVCRNIWRTKVRDHREYQLHPGEGENDADEEVDLIEMIHRAGRERIYYQYFNQLGEQCRVILRLFFERVKMKEIAERLSLTEPYVKKRKFECKKQLIDFIRDDPRFSELKSPGFRE